MCNTSSVLQPILLTMLKFKPIPAPPLHILFIGKLGLGLSPSQSLCSSFHGPGCPVLTKDITETLIMVFTDVQRFVDSQSEMEPFKQTAHYMNEGKEEIIICS